MLHAVFYAREDIADCFEEAQTIEREVDGFAGDRLERLLGVSLHFHRTTSRHSDDRSCYLRWASESGPVTGTGHTTVVPSRSRDGMVSVTDHAAVPR